MFDAFFTDDHLAIRDMARDFATNRIAPIAPAFDESGEFPLETIREMGQMGFMGIEVPEQYGGAGLQGTIQHGHQLRAPCAERVECAGLDQCLDG